MNDSNNATKNGTYFTALNNTKMGLGFALFFLVLLAILIPFMILRSYLKDGYRRTSSFLGAFLAVFNCFAAGIFMTTGLLELFPEVLESTETALTLYNVQTKFHWGSLIVISGLFLIMFIEELMHQFHHQCEKAHLNPNNKAKSDNQNIDKESKSTEYNTFDSKSDDLNDKKNLVNIPATTSIIDKTSILSTTNIYIMILALSFHSIFEGIALGLQDKVNTTLMLFMGMSIHKTVICITIGLEMAQSLIAFSKAFLASLPFAIASPFGLLLGVILQRMNKGGSPALLLSSSVLQGIACGTFLYIVFFDILPKELENKSNRFIKACSMCIGFSLVAVLTYLSH